MADITPWPYIKSYQPHKTPHKPQTLDSVNRAKRGEFEKSAFRECFIKFVSPQQRIFCSLVSIQNKRFLHSKEQVFLIIFFMWIFYWNDLADFVIMNLEVRQ